MKKALAVIALLFVVVGLTAEVGPMPTCPPGPNGSLPRCGGHMCNCYPS